MEPIRINAVIAVELAECLEFLCDWIDHDRDRLDASLWRFSGGGYPIGELRDDLRRFAGRLDHATDIVEERQP